MQRAFIQKTTITSTALFQSTRNLTTSAFRMSTTHQSHATDPQSGSYVPQKAQEKLPKGVEDTVPDASESSRYPSLKLLPKIAASSRQHLTRSLLSASIFGWNMTDYGLL
jgi:hypothetical protein